jgi:hypothetical protein
MNSTLRSLALAASLLALPVLASARDSAAPDRAASLLAARGAIELSAVGRTIERGTYRVEVVTKLGQGTVLADGTRLFAGYSVDDSAARGTLVVRFDAQGRVTQLKLVTPAVATALAAEAAKPATSLVAAHR